jgi:hypothetical protein
MDYHYRMVESDFVRLNILVHCLREHACLDSVWPGLGAAFVSRFMITHPCVTVIATTNQDSTSSHPCVLLWST